MKITAENINNYSDESLLEVRLCDIKIPLREAPYVMDCFNQLRSELKEQKLKVSPRLWVSDDWYSPDGCVGFAVPFFLLHPRLIKLTEKMIFEAEGSHRGWCMRLMRHEMGHVMDNAYGLRRRRLRQKLFGLSSTPYPETYSPKPYSKKFVRNLDSWYAQAHPDEDWAETFAVWLNPKSNWRNRYKRGVVSKKINYLDEVMLELAGKMPPNKNKQIDSQASLNRVTLRSYFRQRKGDYNFDELGFFDADLKKIFTAPVEDLRSAPADRFIKNERAKLRMHVSRWTGHYQYKISHIIDHLIERSRALDLQMKNGQEQTMLDLTAMLSAKTASFLATGEYEISL